MSQEYTSSSMRRQRRAGRSQRNKPVLVTSAGNEVAVEEVEGQNTEPQQETSSVAEETVAVPASTPTTQPPARRLPRFFSSVSKDEQGSATKESKDNEAAQARLARATRKTTAEVPTAKKNETTTTETKPTPAARPAANRASTAQPTVFKTRYIIGMGLYLLAANFVGIFETQFLRSVGLDVSLTKLNVFGGIFDVRSSTLLFLATLVILLILLARFDLIPRSLGAASSTQRRPGQGQSQQSRSSSSQGERATPPTMRQGVKGADDELYREYRANQRREKKR